MCKDRELATAKFYDELREESVTKRHAIFEVDRDGKPDLIGFAATFAEGFMTFFDVDSENEVHCSNLVPIPAMGNRGVAAFFGGDYAIPC